MKKQRPEEYVSGLIRANGLHCAIEIAKRGVKYANLEFEKEAPRPNQEISLFASKKSSHKDSAKERKVNYNFWLQVLSLLNKSAKNNK